MLRCFDKLSKRSTAGEAQQDDFPLIELGAELIEVVEMSRFKM